MQIQSLSAARILRWFGPQSAGSGESLDRVVLGEDRSLKLPRITLQPSSPPEPPPSPEGDVALAFLSQLRPQLIAGSATLDKPMQGELGRLAHGQAHPLAARLARVLLDDHAHYDSALEKWTAEAGDPVAYLELQHDRLSEERARPDDARPLHLEVWDPFLDHLQSRPMTPTALRTMVHLWQGLEERSAGAFDDDFRSQEPVEQDRRLAARCRNLVQGWLESGQAVLVGGSLDQVRPGVAVEGNRIEVHPRPLDLARLDPDDPDPTARLTAEGRLGRDGGELASALGKLLEQHPHLQEAGYVGRNLVPLLLSDQVGSSYGARSVLTGLFERKRELMSPVLQFVVEEHREIYLSEPLEKTIEAAAELGWRPDTPEQVDWVAGKLFQSRGGMGGEHLMRSSSELDLAIRLLKDCPMLPSSVPRAALDHLLGVSSQDQVLDLWNHQVDPWLVGDRAGALLDQVEAANREAGSLEALSARNQATLALLHQAPKNHVRLDALLQGDLERQPEHRATRRLVDAARLRALESGPERLAKLEGNERSQELGRLLRLNLLLSEEVPDPPWGDRMEEYESQLPSERSAPLLAVLEPGERAALVEPALARFEAGYGSLDELGPEARGALSLLANLWSEQPQLKSRLFSLLLPELASGNAQIPSELERLVDEHVTEHAARALEGFVGQDLPERLQSYETSLQLSQAVSSHQERRKLEQSLRDGFCAQAKKHPVLSRLEDPDDLTVLRELVADPDGWARGGERYLELSGLMKEDAMQVYLQARELRSQGMPWESARELALRRHLKLPDGSPGGRVELSSQRVTVGGVVVRERRRS